ncbi:MAG: NifU family protein [Mycoplasmataceae bacterium]|jgi:Fe-S cluster biogenesis protein NfuA|nr:NifU family protein [Mycoplasmataceae bacterium]
MIKKIKKVINDLRVYLENDGGDMEYVDYDKKSKILKIKVKGACVGCVNFDDTFENGIKQIILEKLSFVKEVEFI